VYEKKIQKLKLIFLMIDVCENRKNEVIKKKFELLKSEKWLNVSSAFLQRMKSVELIYQPPHIFIHMVKNR